LNELEMNSIDVEHIRDNINWSCKWELWFSNIWSK